MEKREVLAEKEFPQAGIKVIAHKDTENGKAYRSIELMGIGIKAGDPLIKKLETQYKKSLSKAYSNLEDFEKELVMGAFQIFLIPDIQYGDATVLSKFEAVCAFIEKNAKVGAAA